MKILKSILDPLTVELFLGYQFGFRHKCNRNRGVTLISMKSPKLV